MKKRIKIIRINLYIFFLVAALMSLSYVTYSRFKLNEVISKYGSQDITAYNVHKSDIPKLKDNSIVAEINIVDIYSSYQENNRQIYIGAMDSSSLAHIKIDEGRLPEGDNEIVLCQSALEYIGSEKKLGDYIIINDYNLHGKYRIVGIANDFLTTNVIYSFDNSHASQIMPDGLIKYNETIDPITTNILIKYNRNMSDEQIQFFLNENSLTNYQQNSFVYENNKLIIPNNNIEVLFYIMIIIIIIPFILAYVCFCSANGQLLRSIKLKFTIITILIMNIGMLFLINIALFIGINYIQLASAQNEVNVHEDLIIRKTVEFSTGALYMPVNLYDGLTESQYDMIIDNIDVENTHSIKNMPINIIENRRDLGGYFSKIEADKRSIEEYKYSPTDRIYTSSIGFMDQNELELLEKYNNIKLDIHELCSGQKFILLISENYDAFAVGDTWHFTQIVHQYNSNSYYRIDFESNLGYLLYCPPEMDDLFDSGINIVMSADYLNELGISLPYTAVSIRIKDNGNENNISDLLESLVEYKGNSTIKFESKKQMTDNLNNIIVSSLAIIIPTVLYLVFNLIIILSYQNKEEYNVNPMPLVSFLVKDIALELLLLELAAIVFSVPVYFLVKDTIVRLFLR